MSQIVKGPASSVLDEADSRIVEFAAKVADDATTVSEEDIERLRSAGPSDRDIFDVVLAAAARGFPAERGGPSDRRSGEGGVWPPSEISNRPRHAHDDNNQPGVSTRPRLYR